MQSALFQPQPVSALHSIGRWSHTCCIYLIIFINKKNGSQILGQEPEWSEKQWRSNQWPPLPFLPPSRRAEILSKTCLTPAHFGPQSTETSEVNSSQLVASSALWFKGNFIVRIWSKYHTTHVLETFRFWTWHFHLLDTCLHPRCSTVKSLNFSVY